MILDRYELTAGRNLTTFEFVSEGKRGRIVKIIQFQPMNIENVYNLAFGDKNMDTGELDDNVITDNGDSGKVLATVIAALYVFTDRYPDTWIYATGSSNSRTRLYRMGINKYYDIASSDFDIRGECKNEWEWYEYGKDYQTFAVHKKNSKFGS
ncbi:MAG TPA: hypothetical protein VIJ95_12180 [Hanamia sp.]